VLVALTGGLPDSVPIGEVRDAVQALRKAVADISVEDRQRCSSDETLTDDDRKAILQVVGKATAPFQAQPVAEAKGRPARSDWRP